MKYAVAAALAAIGLIVMSCAPAPKAERHAALPGVITQEEWGGRPFTGDARKHSITRITLHHEGVENRGEKPTPEFLRSFQQWCKTDKKWIDIPYHYMIDLDGVVYEGRHIEYAGDTNTMYDPAGHALICVLGNYEVQVPSERQLNSIVRLMAKIATTYHVPVDSIAGHRDVADSTVCPGAHLYAYLANGWITSAVAKELKQK